MWRGELEMILDLFVTACMAGHRCPSVFSICTMLYLVSRGIITHTHTHTHTHTATGHQMTLILSYEKHSYPSTDSCWVLGNRSLS